MSLFKKEEITAFEIVTLHLSGMRVSCDYEMVMKDGKAEVSYYEIKYGSGEPQRELIERAVCDEARALGLLRECRVIAWDGFDGPHPKGVLDGTMFRLDATVNGGRQISAQGSQNFPRHFREFEDGLRDILREAEL